MDLMCPVCLKDFKRKPYIVNRNKHAVCCSKKCSSIFRASWFLGSANHQTGLKGNKNKSFKSYKITMKRGTNRYIFIYEPWHPYAESTGRIRQHRFVVENNYLKFKEEYFHRVLDDKDNIRWVLKPKYDVHHKDYNTLNNDITNLEILTRGEHTREHNRNKEIIHDPKTGRITGIKSI